MVEELGPNALEALLEREADVQIVDVRPAEGFESGHIPGSENVPFEQLISSIDTIPWDDRVVFVCPYGQRSKQACELLSAYEEIAADAEVYNLKGGLQAWDGPIAMATSE